MSAIAVGKVGVVVEEEPLPHLGWWRLFEKEEEEGSMGIDNRAPGNDGRAVPPHGWAGEGEQAGVCPKCGHNLTVWGDKHLCPQCDAVKLRLLMYMMLGMQFRQQQERSQR